MWSVHVAIIAALVWANSALAAPTLKTAFPRLGGTKIGAPHAYDDPATQAQLAKLDYILIDLFPNWGSVTKMRNAVKAIKAKNPNIVILDYVIQEAIHNTSAGLKRLRNKLDAEHWWLYQNGGGGTKVSGPLANDPAFTTNFTNTAPKDANGDRWNTWFAKYVYNTIWSKVPELDGTFTDNVFWKPRVSGDWNRDGTTDSQKNAAIYPEFRAGMMAHLNKIKELMPGKLVTGNIGDWGRPEATVPEYAGQLDGGLLERYIGETWSNEGIDQDGVYNGRGSWSRMMGAYHKVMGLVKAPKLVIFGMKGKPTDYKAFRYGFASALMDDAYFDFSDGTGSIYTTKVVWFDEYDLAGSRNTSWLGNAIDSPQTAPWQNGVYRRRFQNGMVLVNPRGNGDRTVTIGSGYKRFKGKQDTAHNNGLAATSVELADRDGILLVATTGDADGGETPAPPPSPSPPVVRDPG
ncbi:MAG: putative glycoside hydrolase [Gammaproteobacteria bacterium]